MESCSPCFQYEWDDCPCLSAPYTGLLQTKSYFYNRELSQRNFMLVSHGFVLSMSVVILLLLFFIARYLLYSIVLVSAIHQHESATGISVPSLLNLPPISHPSRESQSSGLSSLCHRAAFPLAICVTQGKECFHAALSTCPSLSFLTVSASLSSMSASPLLPCN